MKVPFSTFDAMHGEIREEMLAKFAEACSELGSIDKKPTLEGRQLTMFIAPNKNHSK